MKDSMDHIPTKENDSGLLFACLTGSSPVAKFLKKQNEND